VYTWIDSRLHQNPLIRYYAHYCSVQTESSIVSHLQVRILDP